MLGALLWVINGSSDPLILYAAAVGLVLVFAGEMMFLRWSGESA